MKFALRRGTSLLLLAVLLLPQNGPVLAKALQNSKVPASAATQEAGAPRPWLYQNSDVPIDPAWRFGTLDNGLRYAIRRNGVPPGQVSIRIRVDVGSLMERADERGFAHFIEHLTFRGSREVPDGEAKRVWQRLGATFGSDSNAQTTMTGTTYALDLPQATPNGLGESMKILAGMVEAPNIVPAAVNAERSVIMAEKREGESPATVVGDTARSFYFAGQPLAERNPIGTNATLAAAAADKLRAFHDRWYQPQRTVISISGDVDPAIMETYVRRYFSDWKPTQPAAPLPDFGQPNPKAPESRVIVEPHSPTSVGIAYLRPWHMKADTIAYNQGKLVDQLALQLINRRLEQAARASGASFLQASVDQQDVSRSVDGTFVSITPIGNDWKKALDDVRAIIADACDTPPSQADIDREYSQMDTAFAIGAENADTESSATQAETLTQAVDIRETTVSPQAALDIFRSAKPQATPDHILQSTRNMFKGDAKRVLLTLREPEPGVDKKLSAAFNAPVKPTKDVRLAAGAVTMDSLPKLPPPGMALSNEPLGALEIRKIAYANGVTLILFPNRAETEKVRINVRFGNGQQSFAPGQDGASWAAPYVLAASGIGDIDQRGLDDLTNGRRLEFKFEVGENAFELSAVTRPADYRDQLRLFATKLMFPRWDAEPLARLRGVLDAAEASGTASPGAVLGRDLQWLLRNKDARFTPAIRSEVDSLTLEHFKQIWAPRLSEGPIEVQIFGDVNADEAIKAVADTFGALPPRKAVPVPPNNAQLSFPAHVATPVVLRHDGSADQAAGVIAWPTGGGYADVKESRQLEALSQIINDRLFETLRSVDGAAYSPNVNSYWPLTYRSGGYLVVISQLKPERIALLGSMVRQIAHDLATTPVSDDELQRAVGPMRQLLSRASTGNAFWMSQTEGATRDPNVIPALKSFSDDLLGVTAADVQRLAAKYLIDNKSWSAIVLSRNTPVPSNLAQGWPQASGTTSAATR